MDVLRLWAASADTTSDITISNSILESTAEMYRKLRNTARFMLGALFDYTPAQHAVDFSRLMQVRG